MSEQVRSEGALQAELARAREERAAIAAVLEAVARATDDPAPVFDAILAHAGRLCNADRATVALVEGERLVTKAGWNIPPAAMEEYRSASGVIDRTSGTGRGIVERRTILWDDISLDSEISPTMQRARGITGARSIMVVPLMRDGVAIGAINLRRTEVRPYTRDEAALVETFAQQAVLAIDHARHFKETRESLDRQTAISEILATIGRARGNPTEVFDSIVRTARRLCGADSATLSLVSAGTVTRAAHIGDERVDRVAELDPVGTVTQVSDRAESGVVPLAITTKRTQHTPNFYEDPRFSEAIRLAAEDVSIQVRWGATRLAVPVMVDGEVRATIRLVRQAAGGFSGQEVELVEAFAAQAAIALENTRLFNETRDSLLRQTAISEILGVISRSPEDVQPVLEVIAKSARSYCSAEDAMLIVIDDGRISANAHDGDVGWVAGIGEEIDRSLPATRAILDRAIVHVPDLQNATEDWRRARDIGVRFGIRTVLSVPMTQGDRSIGSITLRRKERRAFTDPEISLLRTFADQAVIAIGNTRLFNQTKASLDRQTALSNVLRAIAGSPTDERPVLKAIAASAIRYCAADDASVLVLRGDELHNVAHEGPIASLGVPLKLDRDVVAGRAVIDGRTVHLANVFGPEGEEFVQTRARAAQTGQRATVATPLIKEGHAIGAIVLRKIVPVPFTAEQLALLEAFANQAVIAIENVRLFNETKESLERQTATAEVLRVISESPSDLQPVFDSIADRARVLCEAERVHLWLRAGERLELVATGRDPSAGSDDMQVRSMPVARSNLAGRSVLSGKTQHVADVLADAEYDASIQQGTRPWHTVLAVPLMRGGQAIGSIALLRASVRPFDPRQIELVQTFADQAAIAIQNVRMFNETTSALEQQTAVGHVLKTISRTAFDLQAVFDVVVDNATRLCRGDFGYLFRRDGDVFQMVAYVGGTPALVEYELAHPTVISPHTLIGRIALERGIVHIPDIFVDANYEWPANIENNVHTIVGVPIFSGGEVVGAIGAGRFRVEPYAPDELRLFETFADQAGIAMENARLFSETRDALERQTATSEILRVISGSPTDIQPVLEAIAENAVRFCAAEDTSVWLIEQDLLRLRAHHGAQETESPALPVAPTSVTGRAVIEGRTIQVADLQTEAARYPDGAAVSHTARATLSTPLLLQGRAIGGLTLRRSVALPYAAEQIKLAETFAAQAVIAIENVRLFNQTKESLDQQTAIADILRVISQSPTDIAPVLEAIAESATKYAASEDASVLLVQDGQLVPGAHFGPIPLRVGVAVDRGSVSGRAIVDVRTVHSPDVMATDDYPTSKSIGAGGTQRAVLAVPLVREGRALGVVVLRRTEPRAFSDRQIELTETFANQAAIAIENVRLYNETRESLEQQTAIADILRVISESPTDVTPVLEAIAQSASKYAAAEDAAVVLVRDGALVPAAHYGPMPMPVATNIERGSVTGRAFIEGRTIHVPDLSATDEYPTSVENAALTGQRALLVAPLIRGGTTIGTILLRRREPRSFTSRQVDLVETFAKQAAIAIENVRLFNETKESLEQQRAISEILQVISSSPTDIQPVLDAIAKNAARYCAAEDCGVALIRGDGLLEQVAQFGPIDRPIAPWPVDRSSVRGRSIVDRRVVHVADMLAEPESEYAIGKRRARDLGQRTILAAPLLREGAALGAIALRRTEVKPFTEKQISLLRTFADQAAIAIENVRLFNETKESLDRQTAISEVLKTISGTVFDLEPTLRAVVENAARLVGADFAWMSRRVGETFLSPGSARWARTPELASRFGDYRDVSTPKVATVTGSLMSRLISGGRTMVIADIQQDRELSELSPTVRQTRPRSVLGVPVRSDDSMLGAFVLARIDVRPFTPRDVQLAETFADQAAIAIKNVSLFNEIQEKSRELEVANRHKSEFLANMSHELRTPLNAVIGFSEVLTQGIFGEVNEKQKEYLEDILSSGKHLLSLINDILDLSKIEAGRMELEPATFSLANALDSGLMIVRERAARHGITLKASVPPDLPSVVADERKVKQILFNLLSNAVKFTPDGGRIDVRVAAEQGDVRIDVQDTGIGIAPEDQARIFQEFQQVGRERSREGTGLGLTLSKRYVELHGGRLWVESTPGKGSTFSFTLPLRQPVEAGAGSAGRGATA